MTRIFEINKLLLATYQYAGKRGVTPDVLLHVVDRVKLGIESSTYTTVLEMCQDLHLVVKNDQYVSITDCGRQYLDLMTYDNDKALLDPNSLQRKFLLGLLENSTRLAGKLKVFFDGFQIDFAGSGKIWFAIRKKTELPDDLVLEVGLVKERGGRLEVDVAKSAIVSKIRSGRRITEAELLARLDKQKDIGRKAEDCAMRYERNRLTRDGFPDLALEVQRISDVDPCAGYDILSFNGNNQSYVHDRKIEVKGTSLGENRFYWSKNEINVAKKSGDEYWIYFWKNVTNSGTPTPEKIRNPYWKFFVQKEGNLLPVSYEVKW